MDLWRIERGLRADGYEAICGVDEAGRGPLAGPVYAAAVVLPFGVDIPGLDDSKKLSEKNRHKLYDEIVSHALDYAVASASHGEVDELNILSATFLAMGRAVGMLAEKPDMALIDGNRDPGVKCRSRCIVGGDGKSASIAAASILAKVSRDRHMVELAGEYPQYGFEKHKGYGTKLHYDKLREHGPSEVHRFTFLKKLKAEDGNGKAAGPAADDYGLGNADKRSDARRRGKWGERLALGHLEEGGYTLVAEGFRSRFGEVDLIVKDREYIVFVEVKVRKDANFALACEHVGKDKQRKISATANYWLMMHRSRLQPRFDVVEVYAPFGEGTKSPEIIHIENAF